MLLVAVSSYALSGYTQAKKDVDWNTAIGAAQAGLDDYISRLNDNELYWTVGNSDSTNPAFSSWVKVPGSTSGAAFRYTVDTSTTRADGLVRLTTSGKVDDRVRTVTATLRRGRFFDFVYFSDYETGDPANAGYYGGSYWASRTPEDRARICGVYNWAAGWDSRNDNCPKIYWRNDVVTGRFHTNDTFFASASPVFLGPVSSGCPVVQRTDPCNGRNVWVPENSAASPQFRAGPPVGGTILPMPASNAALRREADEALGGRGCLYTGPTRIVFRADGTMAVNSPNTPSTQNKCGVGPSAKLPENGVIFVENVPAGRAPADTTRPWLSTPTGVSEQPNSAGPTFPRPNDVTSWDPRAGDAFVEGTLNGQVTLATQNNVVVTGDVTYAAGTSGRDILGLIAENNVTIYHPVDSDRREILSSTQLRDVTLWAATLSVQHSFNVQNYQYGTTKGTLSVRGSIAQRWRGAVGTFSGTTSVTGYAKDYKYDDRLAWLTPPRFLDPVSASWIAVEQAEATPAFAP